MPFDTENCVKWDSNYIKGYTSEKRDTNVSQLKGMVADQCQDVARFAANDTLKHYDRGVRWDKEEFDIKANNGDLHIYQYGYIVI